MGIPGQLEGELRCVGAHWDPSRKAWWMGKREELEAIVAKVAMEIIQREAYAASAQAAVGLALAAGYRRMTMPGGVPDFGVPWETLAETKSDFLFRATLPDGRHVYCEVRSLSDQDNATCYLPEGELRAYCLARMAHLGIHHEVAIAWLEKHRGCVETELFEFAAREAKSVAT